MIAPEHTAVRVALWRALHVLIDQKPHIFNDEIGAKLVAEPRWQERQDMHPEFSRSMRSSIVGRARFIEDLVANKAIQGVSQYLVLGAGLDTFAQRRPEIASQMQVFEVDQEGPQLWKQKRLIDLGFPKPEWLHFVSVDFRAGPSWWEHLIAAGFDPTKPAVVVSTGVSMYLSKEANWKTLCEVSKLAPGSTFAMTFLRSLDLLEPKEKSLMEFVMKKASEAGTPFLSLYSPEEIVELANQAGFKESIFVSGDELFQRYFAHRTDGLDPGRTEAFLVATT